jgi:putative oxidoreductase
LVLGLALLYQGIAVLRGIPASEPAVPGLIGSVLGLFILAGLWTPAAGALVAVVQVWIALTGPGDQLGTLILATIGGTLAMIGPGAWSIDARLFGRKYIAG